MRNFCHISLVSSPNVRYMWCQKCTLSLKVEVQVVIYMHNGPRPCQSLYTKCFVILFVPFNRCTMQLCIHCDLCLNIDSG